MLTDEELSEALRPFMNKATQEVAIARIREAEREKGESPSIREDARRHGIEIDAVSSTPYADKVLEVAEQRWIEVYKVHVMAFAPIYRDSYLTAEKARAAANDAAIQNAKREGKGNA